MTMMMMTGETEQRQFGGMSWWSAVDTHSSGQSRSTDDGGDDNNDDDDNSDDDDYVRITMMTMTIIVYHGSEDSNLTLLT